MRPPPPLIALAAGSAQRMVAPGRPDMTPLRATAAATTAAASFAMAGVAAGEFRRRGTTVEPFDPSKASTLVTTGANAVSRNPMYVGMAGLLVAHAVYRRSWLALLPAAAFVVVIDRFQVAAEERALHEKFGSDYDAYCAAVPRWLDARSLRP